MGKQRLTRSARQRKFNTRNTKRRNVFQTQDGHGDGHDRDEAVAGATSTTSSKAARLSGRGIGRGNFKPMLAEPIEVGHHEAVASSIATASPKLSDRAATGTRRESARARGNCRASSFNKLSDSAVGHEEMVVGTVGTTPVSRVADTSPKDSYPNVIAEVQGTIREPVFTYPGRNTFPPKQSLLDQSFVPSKCREYGTNNEWYDFKLTLGYFTEYNLMGHPPHLQTPQYDGVRNILEERFADFTKTEGGWVLDEESAIAKSTISPYEVQSILPPPEKQCKQCKQVCAHKEKEIYLVCREIPYGFLYDMENSSGRTAISCLFSWLSQDLPCGRDEIHRCSNVGGGSLKCYHKRLVKAFIKEEEAIGPVRRSLRTASVSSSGTRSRRSRSNSVESSPAWRYQAGMLTPSSEDVERYPSRATTFVPDVVLETVKLWGPVNTHKWVLITGSVKSGQYLNEQARVQLLYEMLPVVIKQKVALGLVICPFDAVLVKLEVLRNVISYNYLRYEFVQIDKKFDFKAFNKMCRDIVYYCQMVYHTVSGAT